MLSIILATIVSMIIGGLWFGPKTLYPVMQGEMDLPKERTDSIMKRFNPPLHFGLVFVGELIIATMIYLLLKASNDNFVIIILPIAFVVVSNIKTNIFTFLNFKLFIIQEGEKIVSILAMGLIISLMM